MILGAGSATLSARLAAVGRWRLSVRSVSRARCCALTALPLWLTLRSAHRSAGHIWTRSAVECGMLGISTSSLETHHD